MSQINPGGSWSHFISAGRCRGLGCLTALDVLGRAVETGTRARLEWQPIQSRDDDVTRCATRFLSWLAMSGVTAALLCQVDWLGAKGGVYMERQWGGERNRR